MRADFNMLATTWRGNENNARSELLQLCEELEKADSIVERTGISGLITLKVSSSPFEVIEKFREILRKDPWKFRYTLRAIPIEIVVKTDLDRIQEAAEELGKKIGENETFRVTVEKRHTQIRSKDLIEVAAMSLKRKVNLAKPDKIFLIEVLGGYTGLSVLKPLDILSILKEKVL